MRRAGEKVAALMSLMNRAFTEAYPLPDEFFIWESYAGLRAKHCGSHHNRVQLTKYSFARAAYSEVCLHLRALRIVKLPVVIVAQQLQTLCTFHRSSPRPEIGSSKSS
jgi:hypothetical protein